MPIRLRCFRLWAVDGGTVPISPRADYEGGSSCTLRRLDSMVTILLVSTLALALRAFVAASPRRAAEIWGSQRLANLPPERRVLFIRWYRAFGILLCLAG